MPPSARPLHVAVDARLFSGQSGGIEQVAIGLVSTLSQLTDGDEQYTILAYPASHDWIKPYVAGPCRLLLATAVHPPPRWKTFLKRGKRIVDAAQRLTGLPARLSVTLSRSDGTLEREGVDVVHFILQRAFFTRIPSLYHPHDLQHRHLPHFFTPRERVKRDVMLKTFCDQAKIVSVTSSWIKRDLIEQYRLPPEKVAVVPLTGSLGAYPIPTESDLATTCSKFNLPAEGFVFYPAQTWPHKNHLNLIDAIARLRDHHGPTVSLICSGHQTDHFPKLQQRIDQLNLQHQIKFLGFVTPTELQSLYRLCRCVCIPTLFEAASGPLNEAFMAGAPAACSNVTSLPTQAADAALVFNPHYPSEIASALHRLWTDEPLRQTLAARGKQRVSRFTWQRAARHFRALYRQIANRPLTAEDRDLLSDPPDI